MKRLSSGRRAEFWNLLQRLRHDMIQSWERVLIRALAKLVPDPSEEVLPRLHAPVSLQLNVSGRKSAADGRDRPLFAPSG
jgi:hypothetical protein